LIESALLLGEVCAALVGSSFAASLIESTLLLKEVFA
jgi:hypothetical protein